MANFTTALEALSRGDVELQQLKEQLAAALDKAPQFGEQLLEQLQEFYIADKLSSEQYLDLRTLIGDMTERSSVSNHMPDDATLTVAVSGNGAPPSDLEDFNKAYEDITTGGDTSSVDFDPFTGEFTEANAAADTNTSQSWPDATGTEGTNTGYAAPNTDASGNMVICAGAMLKERFILDEQLGEGGMGTVWKARDILKIELEDKNPYVAIKILNDEFKNHPDALLALQRESSRAQKIAHPNIATVYDFDRTPKAEGSMPFMTMEYMDGVPLDVFIKKKMPPGGMPFKEAFPMIEMLCSGLAYAHKHGFAHSDFKPGNTFLLKDGTVKILDFGIARAVKIDGDGASDEKTKFDAGKLGALTPSYASMEMLMGEEPDRRDDIYALAIVSYQLLTGRHPFNKTRADKAAAQHMVPAPVKGLSRAQNKALAKGLAFQRKDRSSSVEEFRDQLSGKASPMRYVIMASAAVLLIAVVVGGGKYQEYLHKKEIAGYIEQLGQGDENYIASFLTDTLPNLEQVDQKKISDEARASIIEYYEKNIDRAIDDTQNKYDYPTAEVILAKARQLYPDSAQLQKIIDNVEERKNQLLNQLNDQFNAHLEKGRLLPLDDAEDINDVLAIIAKVDPSHPLLTDKRLPSAYAAQIQKAQAGKDFQKAEKLVLAGLARAPENANLINLRDEIKAELRRQNEGALIASLQRTLSNALPGIKTLADFKALESDFNRLKEIDPNDNVVKKLSSDLRIKLGVELQKRIALKDWDNSEKLLAEYASLLDPVYLENQRSKIASAKSDFDTKIANLLAALTKAVKAGRLAPPASPNASDLLAQMNSEAPNDVRTQQGRGQIAQAYLQQARLARTQGEWDKARDAVIAGLALNAGGAVDRSLNAETDRIASAELNSSRQVAAAEREKIAAERQAKIDTLHGNFETQLAGMTLTTSGISPVLETLDKLAAINPADPLLESGRKQISAKLAAGIKKLGQENDWVKAKKVAEEALALIPDSDLLSSTYNQIKQDEQQALQQQRNKALATNKARVEELIASATLDDAWEKDLQNNLSRVAKELPATDAWLANQRNAIAFLYIKAARERAAAQRFAEAYRFIDKGQRFSPDVASLSKERSVIADAEKEFAKANAAQALLARIEGLKQTLLTQAKAKQVTKAKKTLQQLKKELPADDPFITGDAPQAIAAAYLRLAETQASRKKFAAAMKFVKAGLDIAPDNQALQKLQQTYVVEAGIEELTKTFKSARKGFKTQAVKQQLAEVKKLAPKRYADLSRNLVATLNKRIKKMAETDRGQAQKMLEFGQQVLPSGNWAALPAEQVARVERKPATTARKSRKGARACKPSLAGYGKRGRGTCYDMVADKTKGPVMIVVPAGGAFSQPFAISKYEISIKNYNTYCKVSGNCSAISGSGTMPVTTVSADDAKAYAAWLSSTTGVKYRLPTDEEWVYAATAGGKQPKKDWNCRVAMGSQVIKGKSLVDVKTGKSNGWGLTNYIGNAQEWVVAGSGLAARGGAYSDALSKCDISLKRTHSGIPDKLTGFRLVRAPG